MNTLYHAAWAKLDWLTEKREERLLNIFSSLEEAWKHIGVKELELIGEGAERRDIFLKKKQAVIPEQELEHIEKNKISLWYKGDAEYPELLKNIHTAPCFLYTAGNTTITKPCLAVVGTRKISSYGKQVSEMLIPELSQNFTIVSGLASGVDAYAHALCMENGGKTIAVLGSGIDTIYPRENIGLSRRITDGGGLIISEFPLGTQANSFHFPRRNRIISGLSLGTLIIEGKKMSGSLITARYALEQNREVFAVPGSIATSLSEGCNALIQQGSAKLTVCPEDILEEFGFLKNTPVQDSLPPVFSSEEEQTIFAILEKEMLDFSSIIGKTGLPVPQALSTLSLLELSGNIICEGGMYRRK